MQLQSKATTSCQAGHQCISVCFPKLSLKSHSTLWSQNWESDSSKTLHLSPPACYLSILQPLTHMGIVCHIEFKGVNRIKHQSIAVCKVKTLHLISLEDNTCQGSHTHWDETTFTNGIHSQILSLRWKEASNIACYRWYKAVRTLKSSLTKFTRFKYVCIHRYQDLYLFM